MTRMYYLKASADIEQEDKGTVISTRFYTKITLIDRVTGETKEFKTEITQDQRPNDPYFF